MNVGDVINSPRNSYTVTTAASNSDGGRCMWAFAVSGGTEFFIKQFLEPKYPTPESMGSEKSKARRRAVCEEFEKRHLDIMNRLRPGAPGGGNLVTALEFFRRDTTYYKVTQKVSVESLESLEPLSPRERAIVLRTLGHSLQMLHRKNIVHGDLKPTNVLIQRKASSGLHLAKLIDFDDSYLSGNPPPPDQIVGDSVYAAPEWFDYTKQDSAASAHRLTTRIDVFALGLLIHVYLTGALPSYDATRFPAPAEAVNAGEPLGLDHRLRPKLAALLSRMTDVEPGRRPDMKDVLDGLGDESVFAFNGADNAGRRLVINLGGGTGGPDASGTGTAGPGPRADDPPRGSRLRINDLNSD